MRAGTLRHTITVEESREDVDEYGSVTLAWTSKMTLRAAVIQQGTEEFMRNAGAVDEQVVVFRTRYVTGISTADRIVWREQPHNVREVVPDERGRSLEIRCMSVAP